jgi:hypothetical protein
MNENNSFLINFPGAEWRREVLKQLMNEKNIDDAVLLSYLLSHPSYFQLNWVGSKMEKIIRKTYLNPELALMIASKIVKTMPPESMQQVTQQLLQQLNKNNPTNNNDEPNNPNDNENSNNEDKPDPNDEDDEDNSNDKDNNGKDKDPNPKDEGNNPNPNGNSKGKDGGGVLEELAESINVRRLDSDADQFMRFQRLFQGHVGRDNPAIVARRISMFEEMRPLNLFSINVLSGAILKAGAEWVKMRQLGAFSGFAVGSLEDAENIMPEAFVNDLYFRFLVASNSVPFMPRKASSMPFIILAQDKSLSMAGEKDAFANSFVYTFIMSAGVATMNLSMHHVLFNSSVIAVEEVMRGSKISIDALLRLLSVQPNGGTNPGAVLGTVERIIDGEGKRFFLLYITDAEWDGNDVEKLILFLRRHDIYMYILAFNNDSNYLNKVLTVFPRELRGRVRGHTIIKSNSREMIMYVRDAINTLMRDLSRFR